MDIAAKLKQEIQARGLLMKFVAKRCGIPKVSLSAYVNGKRAIPEVKLRCICLTLGIESKIFGLDDIYICQTENRKAI